MFEISDWLRTRLSRRMVLGAGLAAAGVIEPRRIPALVGRLREAAGRIQEAMKAAAGQA